MARGCELICIAAFTLSILPKVFAGMSMVIMAGRCQEVWQKRIDGGSEEGCGRCCEKFWVCLADEGGGREM